MSKLHFDWQTDGDNDWDGPETLLESSQKSRGRVPRLLLLFLFLLFSLTAGGLWQLAHRVNTVNDETVAAVRAVAQLIHQSAFTQDDDLFHSLILRQDGAWIENQQRLVQRQLFLDRAPLGLWAAPLSESAPITVTLSPDLQTALVAAALPYTAEIAPGSTQPITLQQLTRYEKQDGYWLMTPLPDDFAFWGEWQVISRPFLRLTYPARDAHLSQRLADDLSHQIDHLCQTLTCPSDFQLELRFTRDRDALWRLQERPQNSLRQIINLTTLYQMWLPTPTLVGIPLEEAGYQALLYGYGNWIATRMATEWQDWLPVELEAYLVGQGLHVPYPVGYRPYQDVTLSLADGPAQDVLVLCETDALHLYRYQVAAATWSLDPANRLWSRRSLSSQRAQFLPLPDDASLLFWFEAEVNGQNQSQYWHWDGQTGVLLGHTQPAFTAQQWRKMLPHPDPDNRYLPLVEPMGDSLFAYRRLTWNGADPLGAPFYERPVWSPGLNFALLEGENRGLAHTDAAGTYRVYLGQGHSPFWLDEDTFGYVRYLDDKEGEATEVVVVNRLDEQAIRLHQTVVITGEDLAAAAPFFGERSPMFIYQAIQSPTEPATLLILARTITHGTVDMSYLFTLDVNDGHLILLARDKRLGEPISFSSDGRYVTRLAYESLYWILTVHDLYTGNEQQWTASIANTVAWERRYDWTEDGRWLVLAEDDLLRLLAVGEEYEQRVLLPEPGCYAVGWADR
ncbi:MAG: hypothetical protein KA314_10000 [Chloroflexi bacterium]|nr:hypothetical protein [Chloroflexota bacterium]MBP8056164.1 hypothetical protein [Chloroflexota bacterium]